MQCFPTGMTKKSVAALIKKHEADTNALKTQQANNRQNQEEKLKACYIFVLHHLSLVKVLPHFCKSVMYIT